MAARTPRKTAGELHEGTALRGFAKVRQWRTWLGNNHDRCKALWLKLAKKGRGVRLITHEEARDHARGEVSHPDASGTLGSKRPLLPGSVPSFC